MDELPVELILKILSYLPIPSLSSFQLTSRRYHTVVCTNESYLYHNAALQHHFIQSGETTLASVKPSIPLRLQGHIDGWKSYCRVQWQIERGWLGKAPCRVREYFSAGKDVHRVRVDEQRGFLLTTHRKGGLIVTDLERDVILWSLAQDEVWEYAHCEYDQGFLIFDWPEHSQEIWRASWPTGNDCILPPTTNVPHQDMHRAYRQALRRHGPFSHGHFHPWAHIDNPNRTTAFRFVFPTLVNSTFEKLFLYDVPSARLIQTINNPVDIDQNWHCNYLEINDKYVIASHTRGIRVFSREIGDKVFDFNNKLQAQPLLTTFQLPDGTQNAWAPCLSVIKPLEPSCIPHHFTTLHLSSCGSHLVSLVYGCYDLLLVRNFEQVLAGTLTLQDSALVMTVPDDYLRYLAVDGDRFVVGDALGNHYVISFSDKLHLQDPSPTNPLPLPRISMYPLLHDRGLHSPYIQITKTLFVSGGPRANDVPLITLQVCPNTALE